MRTPPIPAAEFVKLWQRAKTLDEVAEATGYSKPVASQRAARLRRGKPPVELQTFAACGHPPLDRVALNRIARRYARS